MTFEVGNHNSISLAQSNAGIVGRLWMNTLTLYWGWGCGGGQKDYADYVSQDL